MSCVGKSQAQLITPIRDKPLPGFGLKNHSNSAFALLYMLVNVLIPDNVPLKNAFCNILETASDLGTELKNSLKSDEEEIV